MLTIKIVSLLRLDIFLYNNEVWNNVKKIILFNRWNYAQPELMHRKVTYSTKANPSVFLFAKFRIHGINVAFQSAIETGTNFEKTFSK